jgi:DnaJ-domain-containing protein 1
MTEDAPTENISDGRRKRRKETTAELKYSKAELDHCTVLGIAPGSEKSAITAAYKKQALVHHPDKGKGQEDHQTFIRIKKARDELIKLLDSRA